MLKTTPRHQLMCTDGGSGKQKTTSRCLRQLKADYHMAHPAIPLLGTHRKGQKEISGMFLPALFTVLNLGAAQVFADR